MANQTDDGPELSLDAIFTEPPRPPTPGPTFSVYDRDVDPPASENKHDWRRIEVRLVGNHPLWGHYLWNAARALASYLDLSPLLYRNRCVLELGAGSGLPSIVTINNGAKKTVLTDYPDVKLIENLKYNVEWNIIPDDQYRASVLGYVWGHPVQPLLKEIPDSTSSIKGFDLIILSDLIFNHSQHDALLSTCELALTRNTMSSASEFAPTVLVFYTHHRPHLAYRDMEFFSKAHERGWICEKILTRKFPPMFPDDPGEEEVRSTVHGWRLTR